MPPALPREPSAPLSASLGLAAEKLAAWTAAAEEGGRAPPAFALAYFEPAWGTALELLDAALQQFT